MSSGSVPPYDNCKGFVIIGYTVSCGAQGNSAGIDTTGDYMMRISVDWDPRSLTNEPTFYLGSTRRGDQRHERTDVGKGPVNIDTTYEGNDAGNGTNDDTQDIADQQAADVDTAEANGDIPPDLVSVDTDGGARGDCHARVKIWCPKHLDIGNNCAKVRITLINVGVQNLTIAPAPAPAGAIHWQGGVPGGSAPSGVTGGIREMPGGPGGRYPQGTLNPYLDEENDKVEDDESKPPKSPRPADPKRGRQRREERQRRREGDKKSHMMVSANAMGNATADRFSETTFFFGDAAALEPRAFYGIRFSHCSAVKIWGARTPEERLQALEGAVLRIGVRVQRLGDGMQVIGFTDGREVAVVGMVISGGSDGWWHFVMESPSATRRQAYSQPVLQTNVGQGWRTGTSEVSAFDAQECGPGECGCSTC